MAELRSEINVISNVVTSNKTIPGSSKEEAMGAEVRDPAGTAMYARCEELLGPSGGSPAEMLAASALLLMLDEGFALQEGAGSALPGSWRAERPGAYSARLRLPPAADYSCQLILVPTGDCLLANCASADPMAAYCACLPIPRHVSPETRSFERYRELTFKLKDAVISPAKGAALTSRGIANASLTGLPRELLLKIFRRLDWLSLCRVSRACHALRCAAEDPCLWETLYRNDFPGVVREPSLDWFSSYKTAKLQQNRPKAEKRPHHRFTYMPHYFGSVWDDII